MNGASTKKGGKSTANNAANGDSGKKAPTTQAQRDEIVAASGGDAQSAGLGGYVPDPNTNRTGYFNGSGFFHDLGNYAVDALTGQPAIRAAGFAADGDWSNFGAQVGNMGGTPYGAHIFGQADGQVLAPNSGAFAPAPTRAGSVGEFAGRAALGIGGAVTGTAVAQGLGNLAAGGDPTGKGGSGGMGGYAGDINGAADQIAAYGQQAYGMYGQARDKALGYYQPADDAYASLYGNASSAPAAAPAGGYGQFGQQGQFANGAAGLGGMSTFGQQARPAAANNTNGMPTQSRDQYAQTQARNAGPTNTQAYFDAYKPSTYVQDYAQGRQAQGTHTGQLDQDYGSLANWATSGQSNSASRLGQLGSLGPTATSGMMNTLAGMNASGRTDSLGSQFQGTAVGGNAANAQNRITSGQTSAGQMAGQMKAGGGDTGQLLSEMRGGTSATGQLQSSIGAGTSATGRLQSSLQAGQGDTGGLLAQMGAGTSATGQLQSSLAAGNSPTGTLQAQIGSNQGDTGKFLQNFDVNKTAGLGDTYAKLAAEKPGYMEDFYTSQQTGTNPAYEALKKDFIRDSQNTAAARGGFVSGKAIDIENRGLSRLAADEFANRGNLANMAEQARRTRLGQELTGAQSMDQALLGRQQLQAQTGLGRENTLAGLAQSREGNMTTLAGQRENNMAGLAQGRESTIAGLAGQRDANMTTLAGQRESNMSGLASSRENTLAGLAQGQDQGYNALAQSRDSSELAKMGLLGDLAKAGDSSQLTLSGQRVSAANNEDQTRTATQGLMNDAAASADTNEYNRRNLQMSTANNMDQNANTRQGQLDTLANQAGTEKYNGLQLGGNLAANADTSANNRDTMLNNAAQNASSEQRNAAKDKFDSAMRLGDSKSAISSAMDMAAIGALTESQIAALNARLAALGVSAAERKQTTENLAAIAGKGIDALKGYLGSRSSSSSSGTVAGDGQAGGYIGSY